MSHDTENKTRTNTTDNPAEWAKRRAPELGIHRVWREVVDFGEPVSGTGEEGWGRKRVSVARVSILDGSDGVENENDFDGKICKQNNR